MKKGKEYWAVISRTSRADFVHYHTLSTTKAGAKSAYINEFSVAPVGELFLAEGVKRGDLRIGRVTVAIVGDGK